MPAQSSLIIKKYDGFGGNFVDSQYLGAAYETGKPHVFQNTLAKIYSSKSDFFNIKPLTSMIGTKNVMEIDTEIYRWKLQGAEERTARVVELLDDANTTPGLNNTTFRIKLDVDYYSKPDVLLPEDNNIPLAIVDGPIQDGTGYIYIVKCQTDSPTVYLPQTYMQPGARFTKGWTSVASELNGDFGGQQAPNSFMLEHQVSFFAQKITVTDRAMREQGRLGVDFLVTDASGRESKVSKFLPFYEARMWEVFYKSMEVQMLLGKKSNSPDTSGYMIKTGSGLREQLKDGWTEAYSTPLTVARLRDYLMSIFFARNDVQNRRIRVITGTLGAMMFHEAISAVASGFLTVDTNWIQSAPSVGSTPGLAFGAQYVRYNAPQGIVVELTVNPFYDSVEFCNRYHPQYPAYPIDSARMTFLDFAMQGGESNISMLRVKDTFTHGVVRGLVGPNGVAKGNEISGLVNSYTVGVQGSMGLFIRDVTLTGELIFDYDY